VRDALTDRILRRDAISDYTLDADATQIEGEKREAQYTYQKVKGYMPMLGFLFETGLCLLDEFREGATSPARNESPGSGQVAFYRERQCGGALPDADAGGETDCVVPGEFGLVSSGID